MLNPFKICDKHASLRIHQPTTTSLTAQADKSRISTSKTTHTISTNTHTHLFNGPLSWTTRVSRYQKGKTNLDFTEARDSEWHWHQLGHMQVCTSLQTDNHASTPLLKLFYRPDALPAAQPTASKTEGTSTEGTLYLDIYLKSQQNEK